MSKCWYCNNELTSGDSPKHFGICNKCYDKMFKSGDTIIRSFTNKISELEAKLKESEEKVKHWHDLYNERDKQFQSVRQRYHLLNKLQSNYDKKDKLHLAYMQCLELVEENEKLKQQLEETEEERDGNYENYSICWKDNEYLKQQLAEKDKEIKKLTEELDYKNFWNDFIDLYNGNKLKTQMLHENCKDKISFAVKQLEKVKRTFIDVAWKDVDFAIEIIDNQIKQLKEGIKNE